MKYPALSILAYLAIAASFVEGKGRRQHIIFPFEDSACRTSSGEEGICTRGICQTLATGVHLTSCGRSGGICCPKKSAAIQAAKTVEAPNIGFSCGRRGRIQVNFGFDSLLNRRRRGISSDIFSVVGGRASYRNSWPWMMTDLRQRRRRASSQDIKIQVVGGAESFENSWPWMVLLGRKRGETNLYFCSGVLINNQFVLTAAHCTLDLEPFFARLGEHDVSISSALIPEPEDIDVENILYHPKYIVDQGYHDVALLKLAEPVNFRNEISPVCLPWGSISNENLIQEAVTITGWGTEEFGGRPSVVLREVKVKVFDPSVCENSYSNLPTYGRIFPEGMTKENIVCAGDLEGGKDACQGDSGGPIVHENSVGTFTLAGIISKGYGCGKKGYPGLFAPMRNYDTLQWIRNIAF